MNEALHKFPTTPHLTWLGRENVRDDKVFTPAEVRSFLSGVVVVEEKVDGANLGLSLDQAGKLRFQNRGNWLNGKLTGQWECLRGWVAKHESRLRKIIPANHILFGEWCYATHSVHYNHLPNWFLAFDMFDSTVGKCWNTPRRNSLAAGANLSVVPEVSHGVFQLGEIENMLDSRSDLGNDVREGLYLRREDDGWLAKRAKLVRPNFTQAISEHWSQQVTVSNSIRQTTLH